MLKLNKKKVILIFGSVSFLFILIPISLVGFYLYFVQQTINEGQILLSEHCREINPLITARRERNYQFYQLLANQADKAKLIEAEEQYRLAAVNYVQKENEWLKKYKDYLDYKYTRLYLLPEMFEHETLRYKLTENERDITSILAYMLEKPDFSNVTEKSSQQLAEAEKIKEELEHKYDNFVTTTQSRGKSWHYKFLTLPGLDCPEENQNIPEMDIQNLFKPKIPDENSWLSG